MKGSVYKVMTAAEWEAAQINGVFKGSAVDLKDGFIHFSTREQVEETVRKHFNGQADLVLLRFETGDFGPELKWEPSRGGALFPHLYAPLDTQLLKSVLPLKLLDDNSHEFPETF